MARVDYYLRETASGIRRNGVVAFSAMSTAFVALFLLGLSLMIWREFNVAIEDLTGHAEVAVYMNQDVEQAQISAAQDALTSLPVVREVVYWDQGVTCKHFRQVVAPVFTENVDCESVIPTSLRVKLTDPAEFVQVDAALNCTLDMQTRKQVCTQPGVSTVFDNSTLLNRLTTIKKWLSLFVIALSLLMLVSAVLLVSNTLRMGMFARRKEIAIMRFVGATNWHIRVPFIVEGLVETMFGAILAVCGLLVVKILFLDSARSKFKIFPVINNSDVLIIAPWIIGAAVLVAVIAGTIGMRKFLDV